MNTKKKRRGNPAIPHLGIKTRFQPGECGNLRGRPKTRILAEMLSALGSEVDPETLKSYFQIAAERLMSEVFRGNVQAFREFADRVDGRSTQNVEVTGNLAVHNNPWLVEYNAATLERKKEMGSELDDKILAAAERIKAERADTPENRYRDRLREYSDRIAAGESHEAIQADFAKRPVLVIETKSA